MERKTEREIDGERAEEQREEEKREEGEGKKGRAGEEEQRKE